VLLAATIAGLTAGLATAAFHTAATGPLLEVASRFEAPGHGRPGAESVLPRAVQRVGLWLGFAAYGVAWGPLVAVAYHARQHTLPGGTMIRALTCDLVTGWAVALFPSLKYPANPPGVGQPETLAYRQALFLAFTALSVAGVVAADVFRSILARWSPGTPAWWALVVYGMYSLVLYLFMPPNPDPMPPRPNPVALSSDFIDAFRSLSATGLCLFWAVLGLTFGLALRVLTALHHARSPAR
jgi:hypothetical protein